MGVDLRQHSLLDAPSDDKSRRAVWQRRLHGPGRVAGGGGKADDGTGGISGVAGQGADDPTLELPDRCAPTDMRFACNPVTNMGRDTDANEACEYDGNPAG